MANMIQSPPIWRFHEQEIKAKAWGGRGVYHESDEGIRGVRKGSKRSGDDGGGLERETATGEHDYEQNHDENERGSHLWPRHYLVKLLGPIVVANEL